MNIRGRLKRIEDKCRIYEPDELTTDPYHIWEMRLVEIVYETDALDELIRKLAKHGPAPEPTTRRGEEAERQVRKAYGEEMPELSLILTARFMENAESIFEYCLQKLEQEFRQPGASQAQGNTQGWGQ